MLRRLKRRSLANLREEIEPVEQHRLAAFSIDWSGLSNEPPRGVNAAADAVARLQGAAIPASILERDVLAMRAHESSQHIDKMLVAGELVWIGRESLG